MSPTRNGSTMIQRFKGDNAIEIRNGIMFDFYLGLAHMVLQNLYMQMYAVSKDYTVVVQAPSFISSQLQ